MEGVCLGLISLGFGGPVRLPNIMSSSDVGDVGLDAPYPKVSLWLGRGGEVATVGKVVGPWGRPGWGGAPLPCWKGSR